MQLQYFQIVDETKVFFSQFLAKKSVAKYYSVYGDRFKAIV